MFYTIAIVSGSLSAFDNTGITFHHTASIAGV